MLKMQPHVATMAMPPVPYVVVFSELSPKAKARYTRFLLDNNVKFVQRPIDGRYVANIRLEMPPQREKDDDTKNRPSVLRSSPKKDNDEVRAETPVSPEDDKVPTVPNELERFAALIDQFGSGIVDREVTGMYMRDVKILKLINEIYDHRYEEYGDNTKEINVLWTPAIESSALPKGDGGFVKYLHRYFLNRFGLKTLVEQQIRELIEGLQVWEELNEVKRFIGFIDGTLDDSSLQFFLHIRSATQNIVVSTAFIPTKRAPKGARSKPTTRRPIAFGQRTHWLSKAQVDTVARTVFGTKQDDAFLQDFFSKPTCGSRPFNAWIEVQELFELALNTFDRLRSDPSTASRQLGGSPTEKISRVADDGASSSDLSPAPSPLPPPPVPRTLGGTTLRVGQNIQAAPRPPPPPQFPTTRLFEPQEPRTERVITAQALAPVSFSTKAHASSDDSDDDVQRRLAALLQRVRRRPIAHHEGD